MIQANELVAFGSTVKTHGLHGELSVVTDRDIDVEELQHIVLCIDGIFVPFRIASRRPRGSHGVLLTLDGVDNADEAAEYVGHDIYALRRELPENDNGCTDDDGLYAEDLEGFDITDRYGNAIGHIDAVDTSTINTLLNITLTDSGKRVLVPLADEWICDLDPTAHTISMNIPPQLLTEL